MQLYGYKCKILFFSRSSGELSRKDITEVRDSFVKAKRIGKLLTGYGSDYLSVSIQPTLADSISKMTEEEYCDYSGCATGKKIVVN